MLIHPARPLDIVVYIENGVRTGDNILQLMCSEACNPERNAFPPYFNWPDLPRDEIRTQDLKIFATKLIRLSPLNHSWPNPPPPFPSVHSDWLAISLPTLPTSSEWLKVVYLLISASFTLFLCTSIFFFFKARRVTDRRKAGVDKQSHYVSCWQ